MEESRKGAAPKSCTKAASVSLDEDFGKDFLTSWKSTKFGNDAMDFDVETSEGKGKGKKFNFGKLDDFDLGADFDKLPSFKMDISDLDFSSTVKKTTTNTSNEKPLKDSIPGKDNEEESFSFSFDFDVLRKFDLDSHLSIREKKTSQVQPSTSVELDFIKTHKENSSTGIMDIPKIDSTKAPSKPETSLSTSRPPSTEQNTSKQPYCDLSNGSDRPSRGQFSIPSFSGNSKLKEAQAAMSHPVKDNSENKRDSSAQSVGSYSQSKGSTSPVFSSTDQDIIGGALSSDGGLSKEKNIASTSAQNVSERNLDGVKEAGAEQRLNTASITSAIHRDIRHLKSIPTKEKATSSLLYKPQTNSVLTSKQPGDSNKSTEVLNSNSEDMERQSKINNAQAENARSSLLTALEKASTIGAPAVKGNGKTEAENRTFSTLKNTTCGLLMNHASLKNEKETLVSNLPTSRLAKMNQRNPTVAPERDLTSEKLRETNKSPSQHPPSTLPNTASKERHALLSPPLKRKAVEEPVPDPFSPLKRILSSPVETRNSPDTALKLSSNSPLETRKSPEIARKSADAMATGSESAEAFRDNQKPPVCATQIVLGTAYAELPVLVLENNGNVEKAEAISKELGDISSMLKKKQEEAKELLVRAIVNNNKLLMLNHPMYDEKLSGLERFASILRARHF